MDSFENELQEQENMQQEETGLQFELPLKQEEDGLQFELPQEEEQTLPKKERKFGKVLVAVVAALALVLSGCLGTMAWGFHYLSSQEKRTEQLLQELNQKIKELEEELDSKSFTGNGNSISGSVNNKPDGTMTPGQVYAKVERSVVAITSRVVTNVNGTMMTGVSYGSGFIMTEDGYVVTNHHVVEGGGSLTVTTYDGVEHDALLRGYDATNDIAVLKIEGSGYPKVTLGSSSDLIVGDQVLVVGNPLGELTSTLTVGYISAKDRVITTDGSQINMLQTDAAVNSGNSGGPIFNMNGEVVGIITAKYSGTSGSGATIEGIGFAIPMDDVVKKLQDLVEFGYITGAYLGVLVHDVEKDVAEYYGLPLGAYVSDVTEGYCAKLAGVRAKDIIVAIGDYQVTSLNSLSRALQNFKGGDVTTITVWRGGVELVLDITLDEKPAN